jgi:vacuolar-type H+-ATPase subunit C/Vma6
MIGYDYGNARVAAMRGRLLQPTELQRLGDAPDAFAFLAALARADDWSAILRTVAPLGAEPGAAADAAIDRHRGERLGRLPGLYEDAPRRLVEALVMGLDLERVLAVLRHRRAGATPEAAGATIVRGALLDAERLGAVARATRASDVLRPLLAAGLVEPDMGRDLAREAAHADRPERFERALVAACDRARMRRAAGPGEDAGVVREALGREFADRAATAAEGRAHGVSAASLADRALTLTRLDALASSARRDPLGIGVVVSYVAAVEVQAIRVRALLARARAGWPSLALEPYLATGRARVA